MKRIKRAVLYVVLAIILFEGSFAAYGDDGAANVRDARAAVVRILVQGPDGSCSLGTGFGIGAQGENASAFITNWHVVTSSGVYDYEDVKVYILLDDNTVFRTEYAEGEDGEWHAVKGKIIPGAMVECEVLYAENEYPDVAVIRPRETINGIKTLPLKVAGQDDIGKKVYTIGYPGSADKASRVISGNTEDERIPGSIEAVSIDGGEISRILPLESLGNTNCIVHHAHINHGNSGGPLVMEDGSVIGINTYGYGEETEGTVMEYSVSIDIQYAIDVLDQLGIEYTEASENEPESGTSFIPIILIVGAAAATSAVILIAATRKKKSIADASQPQGAVSQSAAAAILSAPKPSVSSSSAGIPKQPTGSHSSGGQSVPIPLAELRLQGIKGVFAGRRFALKEQFIIGRDGNRCGLVYPAGTKGISGAHCAIRFQNGRLTVTDLGSTYGTAVNGKKLVPGTPCPVSVGDRIFLGSDNEGFQITKKGGEV
ncbi:MAG TPA: trypsin-like peptidase domain-containing protein [Candidatus Limivivens intestinipullorum]|uniref:Trypsin-like peptidase domain-containing protein n=1 Tax=Candidatus Limivivens intestinipullorum TaxID=2840858 RepID=A0A9D1ER21_9FIRM|nr:trypsin-like peptidase domain-containing protein [Candidatus Limivivens intestinipullorum]